MSRNQKEEEKPRRHEDHEENKKEGMTFLFLCFVFSWFLLLFQAKISYGWTRALAHDNGIDLGSEGVLQPDPIAPRLPIADGKQRIYVVGHPRGGKLSFSLHDNLLLAHQDSRIHYRTPTEGGNSASPVFNQQWRLIGLHHAGDAHMPASTASPAATRRTRESGSDRSRTPSPRN